MDSSPIVTSDYKKGLSSEGAAAVGFLTPFHLYGKTAPSPNSWVGKRKLTPYPAFYREVREIFFISKKYKRLATQKGNAEIEYCELEIKHDIPRFVELPRKKCENKKSFEVVCADCGQEAIFVSGGCDDPKCFVCHVKWSKKQAHDAGLRMMAGLEKADPEAGELWHFTLSPPENADNRTVPRNEGYVEEILKECYEMCRTNGIIGGCVIAHYGPERWKKGINKYLPRGAYRPHLHVLGIGKRPSGPWDNDRGEWIAKTLNDGNEVEKDFEFIRDGLQYQLSHCIRRKHRHSVRWFGVCSYNKGLGDKNKLVKIGLEKKWIEKLERLGREVVCRCPNCGGDMVRKTIYDANGGYFVDIKGPPPYG